jgi:hypothetical protein
MLNQQLIDLENRYNNSTDFLEQMSLLESIEELKLKLNLTTPVAPNLEDYQCEGCSG